MHAEDIEKADALGAPAACRLLKDRIDLAGLKAGWQ
jgi:hypothetical protein